jgi:hypothetical protein
VSRPAPHKAGRLFYEKKKITVILPAMEAILYFLIPGFEGIAFLASLSIYFRQSGSPEKYLRLLSFYLLFDFIVEIILSYEALNKQNNLLINNLEAMLSFCFYIYILRVFINSEKAKQVLLACLVAFPLIFAANIFLVQKSQVFQSMTYCLGCLLVASSCIYYFLELFQRKHSVNLAREPTFWICSGLLFYSACSFPIYGLINFVHVGLALVHVIVFVLDFVNILLYLSFTIAFLCRLKTRKSM